MHRVTPSARAGLTLVALLAAACTTSPSSPTLSPTNGTGLTPGPTHQTTAQLSPFSSAGGGGPSASGVFPATELGMPVISVAEMRTLSAEGKLDGRFAAVGGYWMQYALPCPQPSHPAVLAGYCSGGKFADSEQDAADPGGGLGGGSQPLAVPETGNADLLWSATGNGPAAVVLIVHAADSRWYQCAPDQQSSCAATLVIDRVAWVNGAETQLAVPSVNLTAPQEQLVTAYQLSASQMNDVDPRFSGESSGQVWYARTTFGTPDADGIRAGVSREVTVATSAVVDERTLAVSSKYVPGRIVLDVSRASIQSNSATPQFSVTDGTTVVVDGALGMETPPITLFPGPYSLQASAADGGGGGAASPGPSCDLPITVDAGSDLTFFATLAKNGCQWSATDSTP